MLPLLLAGGAMLGQGVGSFLTSQAQRGAAEDSRDAMLAAIAKQQVYQDQTFQDVAGMYDDQISMGQGSMDAYRNFDPRDTVMGEFNYDGNVNQFLDPSMAYQQDQARRQIEASGAATGGLGGGAFAKELQDRGQAIAEQGWGDAYNRMTADKQFNYQDFLNHFQNTRDNNTARMGQLQNLANTGTQAMDTVANARLALGQQQINNAGNIGNANAEWANVRGMTGLAGTAGNIFNAASNPNTLYQMNQLTKGK